MFKKAMYIILVFLVFGLGYYFLGHTASASNQVGLDKNGNGVWDDVEEKIIQKFAYSNNIKNAMFQGARSLQKAVVEPNMTEQRAMEILAEEEAAQGCLNQVDPEFMEHDPLLEEWIVNTKERTKNYIHYNYLLSGKMGVDIENNKYCDFVVEK